MTRTLDEDLRDPGLARLFDEARRKFEAVGSAGGRITLSDLQPHEALAIDSLWKQSARRRPRRGQDFRCALRDLDASLVATFGLTLEQVLQRTGGPLRLRPVERAERLERSAAFWDDALAHPLCRREPEVRNWVEQLRRTGALGSRPFATARGDTLPVSLDLGDALPRHPPLERSTFAAEMLGDPHALDEGAAIGDRLVAQLAAREGLRTASLTAGERRALLRRFGVLCDPASATVLTLGLAPLGDSPLEEALRVLAGRHVVLTLGQLARMRMRFEPGLRVRLCENPAVVLRAEDRLGAATAPLICTGGWPRSAVCALLDTLRDAGGSSTMATSTGRGWRSLAGCVTAMALSRCGLTPRPTAKRSQRLARRSPGSGHHDTDSRLTTRLPPSCCVGASLCPRRRCWTNSSLTCPAHASTMLRFRGCRYTSQRGRVHALWVYHTNFANITRVKTIQIRNVPDHVHRILRTRAAAAGVSLSDYALQELERVAEHPPVADVLVRARGRAGGASADAIVSAVRSGRDRP